MSIWVKEIDAKGKLCPVLSHGEYERICCGSDCMSWEWNIVIDPSFHQPNPRKSDIVGRCLLIVKGS